MPKKVNKTEILEPEKYYHILNRAVGNELLFRDDIDYTYFINKIERYILPISDLISYCLIPNHFHLFVRIFDEQTIMKNLNLANHDYIQNKLNQSFSNLLNNYSKTYNLKYSRMGKLFILPYKRIFVEEDSYFISLINYIHRNPIHHGLTENHSEWKYSSYNAYLLNTGTNINTTLGLDFFGSIKCFIDFHIENKAKDGCQKYLIE